MDRNVKIRAKSTIKIKTINGNSLDYTFKADTPVKEILRTVLRMHQWNVGYEQCLLDAGLIIDQQCKSANSNNG